MWRTSTESDRKRLRAAVLFSCLLYGGLFLILLLLPGEGRDWAVSRTPQPQPQPQPVRFSSVSLTLYGDSPSGTSASSSVAEPDFSDAPSSASVSTADALSPFVSGEMVPDAIGARAVKTDQSATSQPIALDEGFAPQYSQSGGNSLSDSAARQRLGMEGGLSGAPDDSSSTEFLAWLDDAIQKNRRYPDRARRRKIEGLVSLHITVPDDGVSCEITIVDSSGSEILDHAARDLVNSLFPAPVRPQKRFSQTIKIQYLLYE